jgi:hypothetical protein
MVNWEEVVGNLSPRIKAYYDNMDAYERYIFLKSTVPTNEDFSAATEALYKFLAIGKTV